VRRAKAALSSGCKPHPAIACISCDEESATEMAISKNPGQCRGFEDFDFSVVDEATPTNGLFSFVRG
jgi:hypothetical protein